MNKFLRKFKKYGMMMGLMMLIVMGLPAALSADRETSSKDRGLKSYPVYQSTTIYKGSLVCVNSSGYLVPAADTSGYIFQGVAYEKVDNSSGSSGDKWCRVIRDGVHLFDSVGLAQSNVGAAMYAYADDTFKTSGTNSVLVGTLVEYVSSTSGWIDISARLT
jgi:hypothetical protein